MSSSNLLPIFLGIDQIRKFIVQKTTSCPQASCLVNPLKTLASSPTIQSQSINSFDSMFSKKYDTSLSFQEQLFLVFQEFHDHEQNHCRRSEDFCLMHFVFPSFFMHICECSTIYQMLPSLSSDYLPALAESERQLSVSLQFFRTWLKKSSKKAACGCIKTFFTEKIPEILIVLTENVNNSNLISFMASVPSNFEVFEMIEGSNQSNYNLSGFLMAENSKIFLFKKEKKLHKWKIVEPGDEKNTSFLEGVKNFIKSGALPVAVIFEQDDSEFFIESEHFVCLENMRLKGKDDLKNLDFVKKCQNVEVWNCFECGKNNHHVVCVCGFKKEYWKCSCGKMNKGNVCTCKKIRPACDRCHQFLKDFDVECRQCGEIIFAGETCQVCGLDIRKFCKGCYENFILCEICGFLNTGEGKIACKRCMNPFIELIKSVRI